MQTDAACAYTGQVRHPSRLRPLAPVALALALAAPAGGEEATVRVAAGTALREVASPVALVLARVEEDAELPVLDRSGDWVRVAYGERTGWIELDVAPGDPAADEAADEAAGEVAREPSAGQAAGGSEARGETAGGAATPDGTTTAGGAGGGEPPTAGRPPSGRLGSGDEATPRGGGEPTAAGRPPGGRSATGDDAAPRGLLPRAEADPAAVLLAAVDRRLGLGARRLAWDRFAVVTDAPGHPLLALGERVAAALPALHRERYGLDADGPSGSPTGAGALQPPALGTVVLFARDADYRAFLADTAGAGAARDLAGHAGGGVAALPLGDRTARQAGATLLHELTHLLNQRALGPGVPPWLDEGLAGDLELVEIGAAGNLLAERWAVGATRYRGERGRSGPLVVLDRLLADAARGRLETLPQLTALGRAALAASPRRAELYALAALWVRFLLEDPGRAAALRTVLATLAAAPGAPPADGGAALLAEALEADLATLERPFRVWLRDVARLR
jgi:hypothetical protein